MPATAGNTPQESESLSERFEAERRRSLRTSFPIFVRKSDGLTWLDDVDPADLPEAADAILLNQAARLAILAAGRLENAIRSGSFDESTAPADVLVEILRRERDWAADFYLDVRRRQAKIAHLENLNRRAGKEAAGNGHTVVVIAESPPKPRRKTARQSAGLHKPGKAERRLAPALAGTGRGIRENAPPIARPGAGRLAAVGGA